MEFACNLSAFEDKPLLDACATIARMGFRYVDMGTGVHLDHDQIVKDPLDSAAQINHLLDTFHLKLSDISLALPRISLNDAKRRKQEIAVFKAMMPFAIALKTPGITLSPGLSHEKEDTEAFDRTAAALREMLQIADKAAHLSVSVEPQVNSMTQTPDDVLKLIQQVKGLQITLNWAQMVYQDVFFEDIVKLLPHTRHIRIRQAARAQIQTPFDRGRIDINRVVAALIEADYQGVVCVEYMHADESLGALAVDPVREAIALRDALRDARNTVLQNA